MCVSSTRVIRTWRFSASVEVLLDRVRGIDDHGLTRGLVADQVGRAAEIVVDELPKLHEGKPTAVEG